jgi:hypothetical protein
VWRVLWAVAVVTLTSANSGSADSLYVSRSARVDKLGAGDSYEFILRYAIGVETTVSVSITKVVASANSANSSTSTSKAVAPFILHGQTFSIDGNYSAHFSVSCNLESVLNFHEGASITISGATPSTYNKTFVVTNVTSKEVWVNLGKEDLGPFVQGSISGTFCSPAAGDISATLGITVLPTSHAYLYSTKNTLFSDAINVGTDSNGLLSNSESSSTQQITAILTELAQTAGLATSPGAGAPTEQTSAKSKARARQKCFSALANEVQAGPFIETTKPRDVANMLKGKPWTVSLDADPDVSLVVTLKSARNSTKFVTLDEEETVEVKGKKRPFRWHKGLIAFFPVPAVATISCKVINDKADANDNGANDKAKADAKAKADDKAKTKANDYYFLLNPPTVVNLYAESQFLDPQRDFLTNPQDTFYFNGSFLIGHKYSAQSPAKTIVDTVTAPIRAFIPSVSVQQTTQVQTGGGKPDQTTTTTQTTVGAPKSP